jgi:putative transposase
MLQDVLDVSERFACKVVGQPRSTQRTPPASQTAKDPDADLRAWLRIWAGQNPRKGHRRAWAALRAEGMQINRKKVHRLWREEDLRVAVRKVRKRNGTTTTPITEADAPNVVWGADFQFDSTRDGRMFKVASMVDEHTRESLMDITDRSITGEDFVAELDSIIADRGAPEVIRLDNGPELVSQALRAYCADRIGLHYIPPGQPWRNGYAESFNNRCRDECLNLHEFDDLIEAKIALTDWKTGYNKGHRHSSLNYLTPSEYAARCKCTHRLSN